jgi:biotin carboxylase
MTPSMDRGDVLSVLVLADRVEVALPACRALARSGHRVGAACSDRSCPVLVSRAVTCRHLFPGRGAPQDAWDAALDCAVAEGCYDVVIACNDIDVVRLTSSRHVGRRVPSISPSQARIQDKAALAQVCAELGIAYPLTIVPDLFAEHVARGSLARGSLIVKAARPAAATRQGVVHVAGMRVAGTPQALLAAVEQYRAAGLEPIVQERVEGPKIQAALIRRARTTTCRLVASVERATPAEATLRQLDSRAGVGADCIRALELIMDHVDYEGLLQAEFVVHAAGVPYLIDLNPRLWGGLSFAELIGLRITERVVRDAVGLPAPPAPRETPGRRYHHVARELAYIARSPRDLPAVASQWSAQDVWDRPPVDDMGPHFARFRLRLPARRRATATGRE